MALALTALVSVLLSGLKADKQSISQLQASDVADRVFARTLNDPSITPNSFWRGEYRYPNRPWKEGFEVIDGTKFTYQVFLTNVSDNETGDPFGTEFDSSNSLRKVDILVTWNSDGAGRLGLTRLVNRKRKS